MKGAIDMTKEEIHKRINYLLDFSEYEELADGYRSDFCWEISEDVHAILFEETLSLLAWFKVPFDTKQQLMLCGYPVLINNFDKDIIRLWKGVRA